MQEKPAKCSQWLTACFGLLFVMPLLLLGQGLDSITLTDGSKLEGGKVTGTGSSLTFTSLAGVITVPWRNVSSIHLQQKLIALGATEEISVADGTLQVSGNGSTFDLGSGPQTVSSIRSIGSPPGSSVSTSQSHSNVQVPSSAKRIFGGRIDANGTASFGATIQRLIGGDLTMFSAPVDRSPGAFTPTVYFNTAYGDTIKGSVATKSSQIEDGGVTLELILRNNGGLPTSATFGGDLYHSFSQGLALKQGYGSGIRQSLSKQFVVEGDLWYDHDTPYHPFATFSSPAARIYESYGIGNSAKPVQFTETLESVLPFDSARAIFFRGTVTLNINILQPAWQLQIQYADDYFRDAPSGYKQNYGKLMLGAAYNWGQ
jgi:hypothetical protein